MQSTPPERIVCLTEETTEFLYLLGEQDRIVGISAYTERPPEAKTEKPVVSAFIGGSVKKISALEPDLVIGFSDVQAELARDLIFANLQVLVTNQRTVAEILGVMRMVGRLVDCQAKADQLVDGFESRLARIASARSSRTRKPRVYFEEWHEPMISAIAWVSELVEIAGGDNVLADRAHGKASRERYTSPAEVVDLAPDIYIGCWCGEPLDRDVVVSRPGFDTIPAVRNGRIYEMDPAIILQPGPACVTDGLDELCRIVDEWHESGDGA